MDAPTIELWPDAVDNGLAAMLAQLMRQNLEDRPEKRKAAARLHGRVALVAEDAETSLTLRFAPFRVYLHDGLHGVPDVTLRGSSEDLLNLSRLPPLSARGRVLPLPDPRSDVARALARSLREGRLRVHGALRHPRLMLGLSQLLSIH